MTKGKIQFSKLLRVNLRQVRGVGPHTSCTVHLWIVSNHGAVNESSTTINQKHPEGPLDLHFHSYKIQMVQFLKPTYYPLRKTFCEIMINFFRNDGGLDKISFSDETRVC